MKTLTNEQKKVLAIVFIVLLSLLFYKKIIRASYDEVSKYITNVNTQNNDVNINSKIETATKKIIAIDKVIGSDNFNQNTIQQDILEFLSYEAKKNKVTIVLVASPHRIQINDYIIITNNFTLKGNYNSLMKVIHHAEKNFKESKLNSLDIYIKKKYNSRNRKELYAELIFQNFKKTNN